MQPRIHAILAAETDLLRAEVYTDLTRNTPSTRFYFIILWVLLDYDTDDIIHTWRIFPSEAKQTAEDIPDFAG